MITIGLLNSYRVIDLTNENGIFASKMFADLGADVIKVEPVTGSSARHVAPFVNDTNGRKQSLFWEAYASNMRGITCDLDCEEGRELFKKLCSEADFLFESESPGVMESRGLSYDELKEVNPKLIHVSITPFGGAGPKSHYATSDLILWAAGGALKPNHQNGRPPVRISVPQAYLHAASDASGAALIAHHERIKSGLGQHIDVSVQQSVAQATLSRVLATAVGDDKAEQGELAASNTEKKRVIDQSGSGTALGRSKWKVKDGFLEMHLAMGPAAGRFTNNFMKWLYEQGVINEETSTIDWIQLPNLIESGEVSWDTVDDIYDIVGRFFETKSKHELMEVALKKRILMAPVYTIGDLVNSEHFRARDFWVDVSERDNRKLRLPGPFARTTIKDAFEFRRLAPKLGEHNSEIYQRILGLAEDEINKLRRKEVI